MIQWWCSAVGVPWTWSWKAYPGVWLFILAIGTGWFIARRRSRAGTSVGTPAGRSGCFLVGALLLWVALDWPVGALGGYLASAHMAQFLLIAFTAPPLLILGWPRAAGARGAPKRWWRIARHPLIAIVAFNVIVIATHVPDVTDALMPSQAGSLMIDLAWLGAGLIFWLPVVRPGQKWMTPPMKMVYLFANMIFMTAPGAMITFSDLPLYATFELAPPIPGITPLSDQRLAGLNMRLATALISWVTISILFLRWNRAEERLMEEESASANVRSGA